MAAKRPSHFVNKCQKTQNKPKFMFLGKSENFGFWQIFTFLGLWPFSYVSTVWIRIFQQFFQKIQKFPSSNDFIRKSCMKSQNGRFLVGQFYVGVTVLFCEVENQKFLSPAIVLERCNLSHRMRKTPQNASSYFLCEPQAKKDHFCPKSPFLTKKFRTFGPTAPQLKPILTNKKNLIRFFGCSIDIR